MKKNNGITIIALLITVIIILILAGTGIYQANLAAINSSINRMNADIKLLEGKVQIYYNKYQTIPITLEQAEEKDVPAEIRGTATNDKYYKIDLSKLENITLNYGNETDATDYYIVNARTLKVYYLKGVSDENKTNPKTYYSYQGVN
jgi:Tfp pilus assembly protein PilE